eukprot:gene23811-64495_t
MAKDLPPRKARPAATALGRGQLEEFITNNGQNIVGALNQTQTKVVQIAHWPHHLNGLKNNLRETGGWVLKQKAPSERDVAMKIGEKFNQWLLNVVTEQKGGSTLDSLPASTLKAMREQGINVGLPDDDEDDLEPGEDDEDEDEWDDFD